MKKINVLITSVGGIVAQGIIKSLKYHNKYSKNKSYHYNLYGTDIIYDSSGLFRVDKFSIIEKPENEQYVESIIDICNKNNIDIVFIGSDIELSTNSNSKLLIESKTSSKIMSNPYKVIEICRDKYKTFEFLKENNLNYISSCLPKDSKEFIEENKFPLVVKPCEGFGSKFFNIVNDQAGLNNAISTIEKY
ncbi:MAG TPA: carbamoyl-phosphate synthase large subunit, partial [Candidatus Nitrosocosmicus sp.]